MRDDLRPDVTDSTLLEALTRTEVALVAETLATHAAQSAYVTAAMLLARSGHKVYLIAPDTPLLNPQPPLRQGRLVAALAAVGNDLLPTVSFDLSRPRARVDIEVRFGTTRPSVESHCSFAVGATDWSASICASDAAFDASDWPFGGLTAGVLVASEVFKVSMRRLARFATSPELFAGQFAATRSTTYSLASTSALKTSALGTFDMISAGAIANCAMYALARIPNVTGNARIFDDDFGEISNLNRNALMLRSSVESNKAIALASVVPGLSLEARPYRYFGNTPLAPRVLVGVDNIPARWEVQRVGPEWLGVGATSHWSAMASFHVPGLPCAGCLHPKDDQTKGPIPTAAFVSFWAGLLLAVYFVTGRAGETLSASEQHTYLTALHADKPWRGPVALNPTCPVPCRSVKL